MAIFDYLTKVEPAVGRALNVVDDPNRSRFFEANCKLRMMDFLHSPSVERSSNEARATQLTVLKSVVPSAPAVGAGVEAVEKHQR